MAVEIKKEIFPKGEEMFSWICDLSQWGHRKTGTPEGRKSAEYIASRFREFGLEEVIIEEVPAVFMNVDLCELSIDGEDIECFPGNATNRGAETGVFEMGLNGEKYEFVYIGDGREDDFAGVDVSGKIVLSHIRFIEFNAATVMELLGDEVDVYDPERKLRDIDEAGRVKKKYNIYSPGTFPENYLRAAAKGAAGFVGILEDYYDDPYWYNEDYTDMLPQLGRGYMAVPAVWISRSSGKKLIDKMSVRTLKGSMKLRTDYNYRTALNVSGKLKGMSDDIVLTHSHHDAVFSGAVQDASGISVVLALAKYFGQLSPEERGKTMMFAATDTHYADYVGHEAFIRQRHANGEKLVLDLCIEHIGKESYLDDEKKEHTTNEPESRLVYISEESALYDTVLEKYEKYGLDKTLFFEVNTGNGIDAEKDEEYEYADDEVITDAYCFNDDGTPVVSMVSGQLYLYHPTDLPDRVPRDQLQPVAKAFAEIALEAMNSGMIVG